MALPAFILAHAGDIGHRVTVLRMLDLFAGLGGASRAQRERGWEVLRVDNATDLAVEVAADLRGWKPPPEWVTGVDLVWASPPCQELSTARAPAQRVEHPDLSLVEASMCIIDAVKPRWWCLENVRGACIAFRPLLGRHIQSHGPVYLWGEFPAFVAKVGAYKSKVSGYDGGRRRAVTPHAISLALAEACERIAFATTGHTVRPARSPLQYALRSAS